MALAGALVLGLTLALAGSSQPARADGTGGKVAGMVVSTLGQTESPATAMNQLAADGINTVSLFVWWWADQPSSTSLSPYGGTQSDASVTSEIDAAHAAGLKVILTPIFVCGGCQGNWRGVMEPSSIPQFFASYRAFMDHYAQLAQADGVWLLFIGSEMTSLEGQTAQWESVIASARQYYSGQVGYEQNWDVIGQPQFLNQVDVVGVSAYFPLDDSADPSESQLLADWTDSRNATYQGHNWVGSLIHLAASTNKPILFGEVGYMASDYAASQPFDNNYVDNNPTLQANLYQALLQTFSGYSWWMGVAWWEWSDASADAPRTPKGKAAETLLRNWYVNGWRPAGYATGNGQTGPTTTSTTGSGLLPSGAVSGAAGASSAGGPGAGSSPAASSAQSSPAGTASAGAPAPGSSTGRGAAGGAAAGGGAGSDPSTASPTLQPGRPYPLPLTSGRAGGAAGSVQAAGGLASERVVLSDSGGPGPTVTVDMVGALALLALAGIATGVPVVLIGPVAAERRRRPALQDEFDLD
ncbi:MAG: glycoside hydrolase family 113 [Acidimicrobiales bacterium]